MRKNHTGLGLTEPVQEVIQSEQDETLAQWSTCDGQDAIKFKCLIFTNLEPKKEVMIYAIPAHDSEGHFV